MKTKMVAREHDEENNKETRHLALSYWIHLTMGAYPSAPEGDNP
ncbi:hypothetical protein [Melghiribacillus thermohalophilus]|nr:hypothetical protein [Melghiribacillus thermohalophilus]